MLNKAIDSLFIINCYFYYEFNVVSDLTPCFELKDKIGVNDWNILSSEKVRGISSLIVSNHFDIF